MNLSDSLAQFNESVFQLSFETDFSLFQKVPVELDRTLYHCSIYGNNIFRRKYSNGFFHPRIHLGGGEYMSLTKSSPDISAEGWVNDSELLRSVVEYFDGKLNRDNNPQRGLIPAGITHSKVINFIQFLGKNTYEWLKKSELMMRKETYSNNPFKEDDARNALFDLSIEEIQQSRDPVFTTPLFGDFSKLGLLYSQLNYDNFCVLDEIYNFSVNNLSNLYITKY